MWWLKLSLLGFLLTFNLSQSRHLQPDADDENGRIVEDGMSGIKKNLYPPNARNNDGRYRNDQLIQSDKLLKKNPNNFGHGLMEADDDFKVAQKTSSMKANPKSKPSEHEFMMMDDSDNNDRDQQRFQPEITDNASTSTTTKSSIKDASAGEQILLVVVVIIFCCCIPAICIAIFVVYECHVKKKTRVQNEQAMTVLQPQPMTYSNLMLYS